MRASGYSSARFGNVKPRVKQRFHIHCSYNSPIGNPLPLPTSSEGIVSQAAAACERAYTAGIHRQRVELVLPLIGATDLDDWPGGIRQQFKAAMPMVESLLRSLKVLPGLEGPLQASVIDRGDAVGAWVGGNLAAILFPTAETIDYIKTLMEERSQGLVVIVNPQWNTTQQVISDFGFLPWQRKAREEVASSFEDTYIIRETRMNGDPVRILCNYPQGWQVNVATSPSTSECILQSKKYPSYSKIEETLRSLDWTMSSKGLLDRLQAEAAFNKRSLEKGPPKQ